MARFLLYLLGAFATVKGVAASPDDEKLPHGAFPQVDLFPSDMAQSLMQLNISTQDDVLNKRQTCSSGYGVCSNGYCGPLDSPHACCAIAGACDSGFQCCSSGGCAPESSVCCLGGGSCKAGNQCYFDALYGSRCCTDNSCTASVQEDGITSTFTSTWTYSFTRYFYTYYYYSLDLTYSLDSFSTTLYIPAINTQAADVQFTSTYRAVIASITAHTAPSTTPRGVRTADAAVVTSDATPSVLSGGDSVEDGSDLTIGSPPTITSGPRSGGGGGGGGEGAGAGGGGDGGGSVEVGPGASAGSITIASTSARFVVVAAVFWSAVLVFALV